MPDRDFSASLRRWRAADIAVFIVFIAVVLVKAVTVADANWDTLAYHLPFAARRVGMIAPEAYGFTHWLEAAYRGFPPLPYYLYGGLWRATGSINAPNVVSGLAFAGYCMVVARTARAPLMLVALATAAVPVIQVNLASAYVDLVANLAFAAALVLATVIAIERGRRLLPGVAGVLACAALAANYKLPFIPLVGVFLPGFALALWLARDGRRRLLAVLVDEIRAASVPAQAGMVALVLLCGASALRNWVLNGNPIYPLGIAIAGWQIFPGIDAAGLYQDPRYLRGTPQVFRWLLSTLDYLALGFRAIPYTVGQGSVPIDAPSLRMGGYFGAFAVYNLIVFAAGAYVRGGAHRRLLAAFAIGTLVVAALPASHELRYFSFWMVYLVAMNMIGVWRWGAPGAARLHFAAAAVGAFVFVAATTGFTYFGARERTTVPKIVASLRLDRIYAPKLEAGGRYCLRNWGPYPMLGSPLTFRDPPFSVVEADGTACPDGTQVMDLTLLQADAARTAPDP
jgi:hypothetical protein